MPILNTTLKFAGMVDGSSNTFKYTNMNFSLIFTFNRDRGSMYGHAEDGQGDSYVIEYCGDHTHSLSKLDLSKFEELGVDTIDIGDIESDNDQNDVEVEHDSKSRIIDRSSLISYSIKVYYTSQVAENVKDVETFLDQVIKETNEGYKNSKVPLRAELLCAERISIEESKDLSEMIDLFRDYKGSVKKLRGTADVTVLLTEKGGCGIAFLAGFERGTPVSVVNRNCALGHFSFGHEIGHTFGLEHDFVKKPYYEDGRGYLINKGKAKTGFRTIMAYSSRGHKERINYYSNPKVKYRLTGTVTGIKGEAYNARILIKNMEAVSRLGDESCVCGKTKDAGNRDVWSWISNIINGNDEENEKCE